MKIAIVNMPHPPIGGNPLEGTMVDDATLNVVGSSAQAAGAEVVVAVFPDGSHRVVKNHSGEHEIVVINRG